MFETGGVAAIRMRSGNVTTYIETTVLGLVECASDRDERGRLDKCVRGIETNPVWMVRWGDHPESDFKRVWVPIKYRVG